MRPKPNATRPTAAGKVSHVISIIYLFIAFPGCGNEPAPPPRQFGPSQSRNPDHEIFDAVLADLIMNPEFAPNRIKPKIILSDTTVGGSLGAINGLHDEQIPPDILRDLADRNPQGKPYSLIGYRTTNRNVLVLAKGVS